MAPPPLPNPQTAPSGGVTGAGRINNLHNSPDVIFAAQAGPNTSELFMGSDTTGKPTVVITPEGDIHRIINRFDNVTKIGMLDALRVGHRHYNLWDIFETLPGSEHKGRFLHVDPKYTNYIANYMTSIDIYSANFNGYAELTLKEFLDQICDDETRTFMKTYFQ